jgi:hypothetical protein
VSKLALAGCGRWRGRCVDTPMGRR